jgi:hypothetical protein
MGVQNAMQDTRIKNVNAKIIRQIAHGIMIGTLAHVASFKEDNL